MEDSDSGESNDDKSYESSSLDFSSSSSSSSSLGEMQRALMAERKLTRRNRVSADGMAILETSSSSNESSPISFRPRATPQRLSDSDVDVEAISDSDHLELDPWETQLPVTDIKYQPSPPKMGSMLPMSDSDSGEEATDKCAICLRGLKSQEVGSPEGCDHTFCFACLLKWSESCNRCPMDRLPFSIILVRDNLHGQVVRQVQVTARDFATPFDFLANIFCQICGGLNDEERMLLCDSCDAGFHLDCLLPPLLEVPTSSWFCRSCTNSGRARDTADFVTLYTLPRIRFVTHRTNLTRTRISQVSQAPAASTSRVTQPARKKRATKRKRKTRKSTVRTNTVLVEGQDGNVTEETVVVKKTVYRRKKKRTAKKTIKKKPRAKPAANTRSPSIIPALRRHLSRTMRLPELPPVASGTRNSTRSRSSVSVSNGRNSTLSLFETRYHLAPVSSDSEIDEIGGEVALLSHRRLNFSTRVLERSKAIELYNAPAPARAAVPIPCADRADLLSSILESQSFWHSKNTSAVVKSDGKIELKPKKNSVDVRSAGVERTSTAAPIFPESESHSGGLRPRSDNCSNVSEPAASGTTAAAAAAAAASSSGPSSIRMSAPVNDREGYRNFLNNIPLGPTPICRTGSPLRFRMPIRPQLRRIPLLPRRPLRTAVNSEDGEDGEKKKDDEKHGDEDCGLYSDVELNADRDGDHTDGEAINCPGAVSQRNDNDADAYDPAEPCDSDDEFTQRTSPRDSPVKPSNDDECPVFSLYSSDAVAFSHKDEEERANLAERMAMAEPLPLCSSGLSFNPDASQEDTAYSLDGRALSKSSPSASSVAPRRRRSSTSSLSSSPGTPRRIRNLPKEVKETSYHRTYRKRTSSSDREAVRKADKEKESGEPSRVTTGLEGLDVEAVSSGNELEGDRLSSLSLSGVSSRHSSPVAAKKRRRKKSARDNGRLGRYSSEEGEINSDRESRKKRLNENKSDFDDDVRRGRSKSVSPARKILSSKENKKELSWKKPSRDDKKFRNSRKTVKEKDRKRKERSASPSPKRDKRKSKDKKKSDKKKELERYDVRKVVKGKPNERKDEFGRDVKSRSPSSSSKSRSWSRNRTGARRSRSRSHSPVKRASRRRGRQHSSSPLRTSRKRPKSVEKEVRKSRRSRSTKRSVTPKARADKKILSVRRSWSRSSMSSPARSPPRKRRSVTPLRRRRSKSWSPGPSPSRDAPMENLTVVVKPKDKKKRKNNRSEKRKPESKKKKTGNLKEVFASGDNVLVSVNFSKSSKSNSSPAISLVAPVRLVTKRRKRPAEEAEKQSKSSNTVSKTVIDAALATQPAKRKKVSRLTDEDAEKILNQKPVAVIDLDESPYREQTPSPINVVVVSDSGSGDEAKPPSQQLPKGDDPVIVASLPPATAAVSVAATATAGSGPKTPPEPPLKFSIAKATHIRPIANPLAEEEEEDEEEEEEEEEETEEEPPVVTEGHKDKPAEAAVEPQQQQQQQQQQPHKGPNTPLSTPPRGPTTPKTPPSPQSSPDAYDPFKPTQSPTAVVPSDHHAVKEAPIAAEPVVELAPVTAVGDEPPPKPDALDDSSKEITEVVDLTESAQPVALIVAEVSDVAGQKTTPQPVTPTAAVALSLFPLRSPSKTPNRPSSASTGASVTGIQRLQHRLGSPVNKTPNSIKSTPEKRPPELLSVANVKLHNASKRNGPLQDTTNEPIDMDDSPYSPATSEGDDLFEPPSAPSGQFKAAKPSVRTVNKFDLLFGSGSLSPIRNGSKKLVKPVKIPKPSPLKHSKKTPTKKNVPTKMDEDQLRILDEVPSSAVELQVKDKFLKKLNRQERVVDEVKTVLKPYYAAKRVNKEEYKDILRRAVPKICHSKSGEINPSKIKHLVEAYVRKCAQKKKTSGSGQKSRPKKTTMFS